MYIVKLKEYNSIQIDEDELPLLTQAITKKSAMVLLRRGAISPSNIICIVPDEERRKSQRVGLSGPLPIPKLDDAFSIIRSKQPRLE